MLFFLIILICPEKSKQNKTKKDKIISRIELFLIFILILKLFCKFSSKEKHEKCNYSKEKAYPRTSFC